MALKFPSPPLAIAHRGGAGLPANAGIENSLKAVANAVNLGYTYVETDVQASADGVAFVMHDPDLSRVAGVAKRVGELRAADIRSLTLSGGESIPTLEDLLAAFPQTRFNIDLKSDAVVAPALRSLRRARAFDRVVIAAFSHRRLARVRKVVPQLATSASPNEIVALRWGRANMAARAGVVAFQVPITQRIGGRQVRVLTDAFIARAHARGQQIHVWTIDDPAVMHELFDRGVDGIVSDRIDTLRQVLIERGQWPTSGW